MSNFIEYEEWKRKLKENGITGILIEKVINKSDVHTKEDFVHHLMRKLKKPRFKNEFNIRLEYVSFKNYPFKKDQFGRVMWCTIEVQQYLELTLKDSKGCTLL